MAAVQVDATSYVAPSAEIVFWSRLGRRFAASDLTDALESRRLVEHRGFLRPAEDLALFTAEMAAWPGVHPAGWQAAMARWVEVNDAAREAILGRYGRMGPWRRARSTCRSSATGSRRGGTTRRTCR